MSSSDQQYPYPYDPEHPQRPAPQWPDGTAGQHAGAQEPAAFDQGGTQTWQAPTWDTQYQPTIRPEGSPGQGQAQAQGYGQGQGQGDGYGYGQGQGHGQSHGHGQPQQPGPYGQSQPPSYGQPQQPEPYAQPQPYGQQQPQPYGQPQPGPYAQQQPQPPHHQGQQPQQAYPSSAADTAYLPPQGASGSYPLPPEVPAAPAAPVTPAAPAPVSEPVTAPAPTPAPATAQSGPGDTGYSAPTTLGNARITDAQRARAEGRSPIIAPGIQPAALTAALGLLLAGGAAIGTYALLVPVVLLQAVTAAGWFRLNGMWPARQGIALAFAGGLVADVALLVAGREHGPAALLGTLGVWVLLTVVLQLRSHAGSDERMYGLMATVVSASLAVLAGGFLAADPDAVVVGGAAVAAATLVRALPLPGAASLVMALVTGVGAGLVFGNTTGIGPQGTLLGFVTAGCALIGLRVASYDYPSRFVHMTAGVALPLTLAAPAVYVVGRALL
ncbi:hypothetical protein G6W57_21175 [Streptomyces sp. CAI-121]|uniref:hypothetical protein n=1 Tax=unclassified Streptomyces TaxID=2593676 RepID=UPI00158769C9|nr:MULTISPECIES: hypothetical protein [unclassified Streptomyces]NUV69629.1 hypothetical protein [Streptomyces sp. CAI-121]NUW15901.1 hypothetical protein [Streptomyces sp. CAI-68]